MEWVIGDIHGCFYTLEKLIKRVRFVDSDAKFIFVGDYGDRGRNTKQVIELMIALQNEGHICLRGNHDDVIDWIVNDKQSAGCMQEMIPVAELIPVGGWWVANGFDTTIESYGVTVNSRPFGDLLKEVIEVMPIEHKLFFRKLPLYWESETHFACHAYFSPENQLPRTFKMISDDCVMDTLWTRFPANPAGGLARELVTQWDKIGVFGHTPVSVYNMKVPIKCDKIRLIDTGVFLNEYLTAYRCFDDSFILQATDSRDLKEKT